MFIAEKFLVIVVGGVDKMLHVYTKDLSDEKSELEF